MKLIKNVMNGGYVKAQVRGKWVVGGITGHDEDYVWFNPATVIRMDKEIRIPRNKAYKSTGREYSMVFAQTLEKARS